MNTRAKGRFGEKEAADYLTSVGYSIVTMNYQTRLGEIDIVAETPDKTLVFVEVKTAGVASFGNPIMKVNRRKQLQLKKMVTQYLYEHQITNKPCRIDVISIYRGKVEHLKNVLI